MTPLHPLLARELAAGHIDDLHTAAQRVQAARRPHGDQSAACGGAGIFRVAAAVATVLHFRLQTLPGAVETGRSKPGCCRG
jgi:hypothetical protein